jgi:uncharacterized protein (UPF0548 family)
VQRLDSGRASALRTASFTYAEVGATAGELPPGYRAIHRRAVLERRDLAAATEDLMRWRVHERAGLWVAASGPVSGPDTVVDMRFGVGPLAVRIPCRVVYVINEPDRTGFAYGTLPGHPERGEESFVLTRLVDGRLTFTVTAFSRPATRLARFGGPATRSIQDRVSGRYLRAADR